MRRRTIGVKIEARFDEFDDITRRAIEEAGANYQGTSVGSGVRYYYFEAADEHMPPILDALTEAGAQIELDE